MTCSRIVVAIKKLSKRKLIQQGMISYLEREVKLQSELHHPNIVQLYTCFEDRTHYYLVMEYCKNGDLSQRLAKVGKFPEPRASSIVRSILSALEYCHQRYCIHRDLKLENILLDDQDNIKLADFGLTVQTTTNRKTFCGTADYLAHEVVTNKTYDQSVDLWGLGVIAFELTVGHPPFNARSQEATFHLIEEMNYDIHGEVSAECEDFIRRLLTPPDRRMTVQECLHHPWVLMYKPEV